MTNFDVESKKYDVLGDNSPEHRILLIIEKLRPYVQSHGGNVEFDHLADSVVFIRFSGTCVTCPLS
ncbi:NifU family protein, partial [Candidatus Babeliales bacterium]|nr:NifU family protein [Candidatus Babeliales bacterium]